MAWTTPRAWWRRLKRQRVLGLDVGSRTVKLVEACHDGRQVRLEQVALLPLAAAAHPPDAAALGDMLHETMERYGFRARQTILSVGGPHGFLRELQLPAMPAAELQQAVRWELPQHLPAGDFYHEAVVLDPGIPGGQARVLLTAASKEQVDWLVQGARHAGLQPLAVELDPLALQRALGEEQDCLLLDLGGERSQMALVRQGVPVACRTIFWGGRQCTRLLQQALRLEEAEAEVLKCKEEALAAACADEALQAALEGDLRELALELRRTLDYYQGEHPDFRPQRLWLSGGGSLQASLPGQLSSQVGLPVKRHPWLETMAAAPTLAPIFLAQAAPQLAVAAGLALRGAEP